MPEGGVEIFLCYAVWRKRDRKIVHCAAYTAVDRAENESDQPLAYKVNVTGSKVLAEVAKANGALLVHVSTDFVFDGTGYLPYKEDAATNPISVYGQTKLDGELAVKVMHDFRKWKAQIDYIRSKDKKRQRWNEVEALLLYLRQGN